jgi:hypothetical protein
LNTIVVGSVKAVVRTRVPAYSGGGVQVRCVHGVELMALVGWAASDYIDSPFDWADPHRHESWSSMAGNAFSAFAVGPVVLAVMCVLATSTDHTRSAHMNTGPIIDDDEFDVSQAEEQDDASADDS